MTSSAQISANQANAKLSTGPRSPEGKARSSQNRTTHGLHSRNVLLPGEDPDEFDALLRKLTVDHLPSTAIERGLVRTIAECQWRLDRLLDWESRLIAEALEGDPAAPSRLMTLFSRSGDPSDAMDRLHRHESLVRRALNHALKEFRAQKTARHRANTVEASTTLRDVEHAVAIARSVAAEIGLEIPAVTQNDDSNPISDSDPAAIVLGNCSETALPAPQAAQAAPVEK